MSNNDNLTAVLEMAIRNKMAELQTAMPGKIVSYDFRTQKAVVQPTIKRRYADGKNESYPVINNVPVIFPRSGGASMTFPVKPGDTVLLIFTSRSVDGWVARGGTVDQDDNRMHSINDAIAIPGLNPFTTASMAKNNNDVLLTYKGSEVEIKQDGEIRMKSAQKVLIDSPDVYMTGDLTVKNDIFDRDKQFGSQGDQRDKYNNHRHNENNNTDAPTDEPLPQYIWDDVT